MRPGQQWVRAGFSFSPAELYLFTKVPCNKCEQLAAAGRPVATLPTPFFLQLPLTSYLKKKEEDACCAAFSFLRSSSAQKQQ